MTTYPQPRPMTASRTSIKCVVWDLDDTLWTGVLLEGGGAQVRPEALEVLRRLDELGIVHSIASKNDPQAAGRRLAELGLEEYFLYPQINWSAKSHAVQRIATALNIALSAIAFVDDQEFERAEVASALPEVLVIDVAELVQAVREPWFRPRFVTDEARGRRELYRSQLIREEAEAEYIGVEEDFLTGLDLVLTIAKGRQEDLRRAEELTNRTNQLNSTGRTYTYAELDELRTSADHLVLVATLSDRFGAYGTIGLALIETGSTHWRLRLLLVSCRVMSRGIGSVVLTHIMRRAARAGARLHADLVETGRNRIMEITYAFAGFQEVSRDGDTVLLEHPLDDLPTYPDYVRVITR